MSRLTDQLNMTVTVLTGHQNKSKTLKLKIKTKFLTNANCADTDQSALEGAVRSVLVLFPIQLHVIILLNNCIKSKI